MASVADHVGVVVGELEVATREQAGERDGQYRFDLVADDVVVQPFVGLGCSVLSEESGLSSGGRSVTVVVDPVDGSTNASRGLPWWATSLCAMDEMGPLVALVRNHPLGTTYTAVRGGGAWRNGEPLGRPPVRASGESIVAVNGVPPSHLGWAQFRTFGALALDLCAVAEGSFDGYIDATWDTHGPWDYLGGALVLTEAGGAFADAGGREWVVLDHAARRTPVAGTAASGVDHWLRAGVDAGWWGGRGLVGAR